MVALVLAAWPAAAAPPPSEEQAVADAALRLAAAQVQVAKIDFEVPADAKAAEDALARRFFNWPEHAQYGDVTIADLADWRAKWRLFTDALIDRAKWMEMDAESLRRCLVALKLEQRYPHGRAVIPVGAYLGRSELGECWIIVCRWEYTPDQGPARIGHAIVWAVEAKTGGVVTCSQCD